MASNNRKRCPNCGATNVANADNCVICGTRLGRQRQAERIAPLDRHSEGFKSEPIAGEDDLLARNVFSAPIAVLTALVVLVLVGGALFFALTLLMDDDAAQPSSENIQSESSTASPSSLPPTTFPTNTRSAPRSFPTITPLPATPLPTPTEGPCIKTAQSGDTLYGLAQQCGHRNYTIVDVILTENPQLTCAACLQEGQTINIPWPTPTLDPNAASEVDGEVSSQQDGSIGGSTQNRVVADSDATPDILAQFLVEPTLRPGLQWHTVSSDENMIIIARLYDADAKVLSDINPEITFSQCDFGERYGGEVCTVLLYPGQRMRVPAPLPTATLSPTPSGLETATPTYTPTFNVPSAFSPRENAEFDANSLVTLRWSSSGALAPNEAYVVRVFNRDAEASFEAITQDLFFVLPEAWQPNSLTRQTLEWTISIGTLDGEAVVAVRETTRPRTFQWQGR